MHTQMENTIRGALYGVAVGDALGAPLEFMPAREIQAKHGYVTEMMGGGWLSVRPGEVTDDTQMTLAVAAGIMEKPSSPVAAVGRHFFSWVAGLPKDVGATCGASIHEARRSLAAFPVDDEQAKAYWRAASKDIANANGNRSGGNGALMRTVYPGLYYRSAEEAMAMAQDIAQMTHWDETSNEACLIYTRMIHSLVAAAESETNEQEPRILLQQLEDLLSGSVYSEVPGMQSAQNLKPTGYVLDSFVCALYAVYHTGGFEDAVAMAANLGGDADTIAAITGGLAGAVYGFDAIPERWVRCLEKETVAGLEAATQAACKGKK